MSELKVYIHPLKKSMMGNTIVIQSYYLKSEADKVIADKDKEIVKLKEQVALLQAEFIPEP